MTSYRAVTLAALLAVLTLATASCASSPNAEDQLLAALPQPATATATATITLSEVFEEPAWDTFHVVCPYASPAAVAELLGIPNSSVPDLSMTDDRQVILLLDSGSVVREASLGRTRLDLCRLIGDTGPLVRGQSDTIDFVHDPSDGVWVAERHRY